MKNHLKRKDLIASREEKEGIGFPGAVGESWDKTSGLTKRARLLPAQQAQPGPKEECAWKEGLKPKTGPGL